LYLFLGEDNVDMAFKCMKRGREKNHVTALKPHETHFLCNGFEDITNDIMGPNVFIAM
jgi:hypothetical protein